LIIIEKGPKLTLYYRKPGEQYGGGSVKAFCLPALVFMFLTRAAAPAGIIVV
jgi:hypothetical protein